MEWFSASQLTGLPGMPGTTQNVTKKAQREKWPSRDRQKIGGGKEYHISGLPPETQEFLNRLDQMKQVVEYSEPPHLDVQISAPVAPAPVAKKSTTSKTIKGRSLDKSQALFAIQQAFEDFLKHCCHPANIQKVDCEYRFCEQFNRREIVFPPGLDVYGCIRRISRASLCAHRQKLKSGTSAFSLGNNYGHRAGQTIISPDQQAVILGLIIKPVTQIHQELIHRYDDQAPSYATIARWVNHWKDKHLQEWFLLKKGRTAFNNHFRAAYGDADAGITKVNQRWEIDATKGDIFLVDKKNKKDKKRYSLLRVIDVYSRRILTHVAPTVSTQSYLQGLLYRAFTEWGIPDEIRTDRGMAEKSGLMAMIMADLNIHHHICNARSPWEKPFIERSFGTRSLLENLPGFSGASVVEQRQIREITDEDVELLLTPEQLQEHINQWTLGYENRVHRGFVGTDRENMTPIQAWANSPGVVRRVDERHKDALSLLLSDVPHGGGVRTVQKQGIQIGKFRFADAEGQWVTWIGHKVLCKYSPCGDAGIVHCFELNNGGIGNYLFTATCAELLGENRAEKAAIARNKQKQVNRSVRELKKLAEVVAAESPTKETAQIIAFPLPSEDLKTASLQVAAEALEAVMPKMPPQPSDEELAAQRAEAKRLELLERKAKMNVLEDPGDRYRRLWFLREAGHVLCEADREFVQRFESLPTGKAMKQILEADSVLEESS